MAKKRSGSYSDHPHVITHQPWPVVERVRLTRDEFAARYFPIHPCMLEEGTTVLVTLMDGVMRYEVENPSVLSNYGRRSEIR